MLKSPTDGPRDLEHLFHYQLTVLNDIRLADEQLEIDNDHASQLRLSLVILLSDPGAGHQRFGMDTPFKS